MPQFGGGDPDAGANISPQYAPKQVIVQGYGMVATKFIRQIFTEFTRYLPAIVLMGREMPVFGPGI